MGVWIGEHPETNFGHGSKDAQQQHFGDPKTPEQITTTNAFSKIRRKFQNRIPRKLDQKLDTHRISTIH